MRENKDDVHAATAALFERLANALDASLETALDDEEPDGQDGRPCFDSIVHTMISHSRHEAALATGHEPCTAGCPGVIINSEHTIVRNDGDVWVAIERCDSCNFYDCDEEAADAISHSAIIRCEKCGSEDETTTKMSARSRLRWFRLHQKKDEEHLVRKYVPLADAVLYGVPGANVLMEGMKKADDLAKKARKAK